jgi:DNA-binding MarR family transcriptional regulator
LTAIETAKVAVNQIRSPTPNLRKMIVPDEDNGGLTGDECRILRRIAQVLNRFREVDGEMPVRQMLLLLHVGLNGKTTQKDLSTALGLSTASVSRNVATLSTLDMGIGKTGLGLVTWLDHPTDRRAKFVVLTPSGRVLVQALLRAGIGKGPAGYPA